MIKTTVYATIAIDIETELDLIEAIEDLQTNCDYNIMGTELVKVTETEFLNLSSQHDG